MHCYAMQRDLFDTVIQTSHKYAVPCQSRHRNKNASTMYASTMYAYPYGRALRALQLHDVDMLGVLMSFNAVSAPPHTLI